MEGEDYATRYEGFEPNNPWWSALRPLGLILAD